MEFESADGYNIQGIELIGGKPKGQLNQLIHKVKHKIKKKDPGIRVIKRPKLFLSALEELRDSIGMSKVKDNIASQISYLVTRMSNGNRNKNMLNTVLYGPPGVGKTSLGLILAKIWYSLGYLEREGQTGFMTKLNDMSDGQPRIIQVLLIGVIYMITVVFQVFSYLYSNVGMYYLSLIIGGIIFLTLLLYLAYWYWSDKESDNPDSVCDSNVDGKCQSSVTSVRDIVSVVGRKDFVAGYVGQTALKTKALLNAHVGRVLIIDEAYSLHQGHLDTFGMEALTTLNQYMSENADRIVIIFCGYKHLLQQGIFEAQPGLPRRCMWHFEIEPHKADDLYKIFLRQIHADGYAIENNSESIKIKDLFRKNYDAFPNFGGDTERLKFFCQIEEGKDHFLDSDKQIGLLKAIHVKSAIDTLRDNNIKKQMPTQPERKPGLEALAELLKTYDSQ